VSPTRLGLVVNPIAGMGGPLGFKGTDGWTVADLVRAGGVARSSERAAQALALLAGVPTVKILTAQGFMGAAAVETAGRQSQIIHHPQGPATTSSDTIAAVRAMAAAGCQLILFAGGDGTARDVHRAIGEDVPVLGIPAGVKMQSAAFALSPMIAGRTAEAFLSGRITSTRASEVVDLDEDACRSGQIQVRLHGYLSVPNEPEAVQGMKVRSTSDDEMIEGIGRTLVDRLEPRVLYVIGPGITAKSVLRQLDLPGTLLGVDLMVDGQIVGSDLSATDLLARTEGREIRLVVSPIGGQGHIFGRGNQQLSPLLIRRAGKDGVIVVASPNKLASLRGRPLYLDTGDLDLDMTMAGWARVITGLDREVVYAAASSSGELAEGFVRHGSPSGHVHAG
jgi:predicted polyphosphate/ATP-dependent NAD kinase